MKFETPVLLAFYITFVEMSFFSTSFLGLKSIPKIYQTGKTRTRQVKSERCKIDEPRK
jgi:hypothetical protein